MKTHSVIAILAVLASPSLPANIFVVPMSDIFWVHILFQQDIASFQVSMNDSETRILMAIKSSLHNSIYNTSSCSISVEMN